MRISFAAGCLICAFACVPALAQNKAVAANKDASAMSLRIRGLRIIKPVPSKNEQAKMQLRPFNWNSGSTLSLLIRSPKGGIIAVQKDKSEVTSFKDDKGKDMSIPTQNDHFHDKAGLGPFSNISSDGQYCQVDLEAPGIPTREATQLLVKGKIVLMTGTVKKEFTADKVALKPGTVIHAGAIPLTVKRAGKPQWGDMQLEIELEAKQDIASIADIAFYDATGKKIESQGGGGGSMSFGGSHFVSVTKGFQLKQKVDVAKVVVTYWMDAKLVEIPVDLKVGVGF